MNIYQRRPLPMRISIRFSLTPLMDKIFFQSLILTQYMMEVECWDFSVDMFLLHPSAIYKEACHWPSYKVDLGLGFLNHISCKMKQFKYCIEMQRSLKK